MRFCKNHPCFGWLSLDAQDYRFVYNKLIEMRDQQMKDKTYTSGLPEGYKDWAYEHLKELAKQPTYKKRIEEHLSQLDLTIANREKELQQTYLHEQLVEMQSRRELISALL